MKTQRVYHLIKCPESLQNENFLHSLDNTQVNWQIDK